MRSPRKGAAPRINPLLAYPRDRALAALDLASGLEPDPFDDVILEYQNPATGGSAMTTMAMTLQKLQPGFRGLARRHTGSKLYVVARGHGATIVDGQRYDWSAGDFLAIKPWAWHEHLNTSTSEDAVLFQVNDSPALDALGYYREETMTANGGHQEAGVGQ
jgi:gentisate 1,2-dioxygenase